MSSAAGDEEAWMPFQQESDPLPQQVSPYATTSTAAMQAVFALLPRPLDPAGDVLLDLGCGDGRIVNHAALHHQLRGVGVDINQELLDQAREFASKMQVEHLVYFMEVSFLDDAYDFSLPWDSSTLKWNGPTLITSYLTPKALRLLEPKIISYVRRAKEQAGIDVLMVTLVYSFNNWQPIAENEALKISVYNFLDESLRRTDKTKNHKDTDGYLPAF